MDDISIVMKVDSAPVDRAVRVMDNLEAELRDVDRAMSKNLITEKQYNAETKRLRQSMDRLRIVSKGSAKDFRTFEKTVYGSGKAMRQKEIAMQQAGYQLQDFIVQIQAGTNPLIAFSQQGSQLAGFFAGTWGAAIGLGIAALGGLGTALLGTRDKGNEFREGMETLNTALEDYESITSRLSNGEGLSKEFGTLAGQAREILAAIQEIKKVSIKEELGQFGGLGQVTSTTQVNAANYLRGLFGVDPVGPMETTMRDVDQVTAAQEFLGATEGSLMENSQYAGEFLRLLEQIQQAETFEAMVGPAGKLSDFLARHVELFNVQGEKLQDVEAMQQSLLKITALRASEEEKENESAAQAYTEAYTNAILTVQRAQMGNSRAIKQAEDKRMKEAEKHHGRMIALQNAHKVVNKAVAEEQKQDQDQIYHNALLAKQNAMAQDHAQAEEQRTLADQTHAHMMALQKAYYDDAKNKAAETANATYLANYNAVMAYQAYGESRTDAPTTPVKPPKTPKTAKTDFQLAMEKYGDFIDELELEERISRELVDVFGSERDIQEELMRLKHEYAILGKQFDEEEVERTLRKIDANEQQRKQLEEQKKLEEELYESMKGHFEDAMMSFIDHTKSAEDKFKDFANAVIQDLYRILVVQQTVNAAVAGIKALSGGGSFLSGFFGGFMADGGQVSNNKAYVVGEEGPEVFMPRSQGTIIPNDKLNTGGNVTVVQHLNISTGVQQTVRSEIRQLMPQIAENAKAAVVDSKRRGGNFGKAFA